MNPSMNRAVEIINSLRIALEHMTKESNVQKVSSLRLFNFEKKPSLLTNGTREAG